LATGERSGELEKALELLEKLYDQQAMRKINLWMRLAEPVAMLIIGILGCLCGPKRGATPYRDLQRG
jgi:type II secretory pathway component PulF